VNRKHKIILSFGVLVFIAVLILISFARYLWGDAVEQTKLNYERKVNNIESGQALGSLKDDRFNTEDPFVTRGKIDPELLGIPSILTTDPSKGPLDAELTIIEYGDFECLFCADIAPVLSELLARRPNVRLVWKDLPNPLHLNARPAGNAARCAQEQGRFWDFHNMLFINQSDLSGGLYIQIAEALDFDLESFGSCLSNNVFESLVIRGLEDLNHYEIDATPFLFVGGVRVNQLTDLESLLQIVDEQLESN